MPKSRFLLLAGALLLLVGLIIILYRRPINLNELPARLAAERAKLQSYRLTMSLEQTGGGRYLVHQWYLAPAEMRTDVFSAEALLLQFFLHGQELTVRQAAEPADKLHLSAQNSFSTVPILAEIWRAGESADWQKGAAGHYLGQFAWRDLRGEPRLGSICLHAKTLLPVNVQFYFDDAKAITIEFAEITLNPALEANLFAP